MTFKAYMKQMGRNFMSYGKNMRLTFKYLLTDRHFEYIKNENIVFNQ